jgi:hypothetical protein
MVIYLLLFLCGAYFSIQIVPTTPKNIVLLFGSSGITPISFLASPSYLVGTNDSASGTYSISPVNARIKGISIRNSFSSSHVYLLVNFVFQLPVLLSTITSISLSCNYICESNSTRYDLFMNALLYSLFLLVNNLGIGLY